MILYEISGKKKKVCTSPIYRDQSSFSMRSDRRGADCQTVGVGDGGM